MGGRGRYISDKSSYCTNIHRQPGSNFQIMHYVPQHPKQAAQHRKRKTRPGKCVCLLAVILARQSLERGLDDPAAETEDEMEGRFLIYTHTSVKIISINTT